MKAKNQNKIRIVFTFALLIVLALNTDLTAQVPNYPVTNNTSCDVKINYECYCPGANPPTNVCGFGFGITILAGQTVYINCTCNISGCAGGELIVTLVEMDGNPITSPSCSVRNSFQNDTYSASACGNFPSPSGTMTWGVAGTNIN